MTAADAAADDEAAAADIKRCLSRVFTFAAYKQLVLHADAIIYAQLVSELGLRFHPISALSNDFGDVLFHVAAGVQAVPPLSSGVRYLDDQQS